MKTIIRVHKESNFVAVISPSVADQDLTEEEAVKNLRKGLEGYCKLLMELSPKDHKASFLGWRNSFAG